MTPCIVWGEGTSILTLFCNEYCPHVQHDIFHLCSRSFAMQHWVVWKQFSAGDRHRLSARFTPKLSRNVPATYSLQPLDRMRWIQGTGEHSSGSRTVSHVTVPRKTVVNGISNRTTPFQRATYNEHALENWSGMAVLHGMPCDRQ